MAKSSHVGWMFAAETSSLPAGKSAGAGPVFGAIYGGAVIIGRNRALDPTILVRSKIASPEVDSRRIFPA